MRSECVGRPSLLIGIAMVAAALVCGPVLAAEPPGAPAPLSPEERRQLRALCFRLGENEPGKKWDAARALIKAGPRAVPVVAEVFAGDWTEGKRMAAWVLSEIRHPSAVGPLSRALGDKDEEVHWKAAVGLKKLGRPSVLALVAVLLNGSLHAKQCSAWTLGEIGDPAAAGALAAALEEDDGDLRWKAAISLSQVGPKALPSLASPLEKGNVETRRCAIWAAGQIGGNAALPVLEQALSDTDNHVRAKAVVALGSIKGEAATQLLLRMVRDADAIVRKDAIVALGRRGRTVDPTARVEKRPQKPTATSPLHGLFEVVFKPNKPPALANPFAQAAVSASFVSPDDRTIQVHGFYAGAGAWKVRTTLDQPGDWFYRVDFRAGEHTELAHGGVKCTPSKAGGLLRIDRDRRRFLVCDSGARFYPIGTGTESLGSPNDAGEPVNTLDVWRAYLDDCARGGMNKSRIVLLEVPWIRPAVVRKHPELSPWPVGDDGRYDLSRFSLPFWDKLDAVIAHGASLGIVFELTLFDESGLARGQGERWALHPFNRANGGPIAGLAGSPLFYDLSSDANRAAQEAYVRYALARTAACANVYYELNHAMDRRGAARQLGPRWAEHWAAFFREHEPFDHLVSLHVLQDATRYFRIDGIDVANVHGSAVPEPTGIRMPVFLAEPHARSPQAERALFWKALLLGTSAARVPWQALTDRPPAFEHLRYLARFAATVAYWELARDHAAVLSTPGATQALAAGRKGELLVYLTGAAERGTVRIGLANGRYDASWFDPKNGNTIRAEEVRPRRGAVDLPCPTFEEDIVLRVRKK